MILSHEKMTDHSRIPAAFCKTKKLGVSHRRITGLPAKNPETKATVSIHTCIRGKKIHGRLAMQPMLRFINRPTPQLLLGPLSQRIRYRTVVE